MTPQIKRFFQKLPDCRLHNHYGPTETHVVTAFVLGDGIQDAPSHVPIGRPIANSRAYLLDGHGQPVPFGAAGELHIGGTGIARGYLNRPELTAERFLADPFSTHPDARMYRTGDLARYLPDGNLEFLGRNDHQVSCAVSVSSWERSRPSCPITRACSNAPCSPASTFQASHASSPMLSRSAAWHHATTWPPCCEAI